MVTNAAMSSLVTDTRAGCQRVQQQIIPPGRKRLPWEPDVPARAAIAPRWGSGLRTLPPGADRRSPEKPGELRSRPGHGRETVPQRGPARASIAPGACRVSKDGDCVLADAAGSQDCPTPF